MKPEKRMLTAVLGLAVDEQGNFLLTQRNQPKNKNVHLKWQIPGGGMEFGETPEQTLAREMWEETGTSVEILVPQPMVRTSVWLSEDGENDPDTHVTLITYLVKVTSDLAQISLDEETHDYRWYTAAEITALDCLPGTPEFIVEACELLKTRALMGT